MYKDIKLFLDGRYGAPYCTNGVGEKYDVLYKIIWLEWAIRVNGDKDFTFNKFIIDDEYEYLISDINDYIHVSSWVETNIQGEMELETKFMEEYEHETFNGLLVDTVIKYREVFVSPDFVVWFIKHSEGNNEKRFEL